MNEFVLVIMTLGAFETEGEMISMKEATYMGISGIYIIDHFHPLRTAGTDSHTTATTT